ncbi:MAG: hypothetical protein RIQ52_335 [Pseudomonadota bacterium]|jgi:alkane 1-monooxygenase
MPDMTVYRGMLTRIPEHLASLLLPVSTFTFFVLGPATDPGFSLLCLLVIPLCLALDHWGPRCRKDRQACQARDTGNIFLCLLAMLQFANIGLMLCFVSAIEWQGASLWMGMLNLIAVRMLQGTTSCASGIAVAHELIHKRDWRLRLLGRGLLVTVLYEHFAVAHLRGHHREVATPKDPATARLGEDFQAFYRRALKDQFSQAWSLEARRLGTLGAGNILQHQVLQGLLAQTLLLAGIAYTFGLLALAVFIYQAVVAVRMLECVNYFQHWGLDRGDLRRPGEPHAWATDSWFSLHCFLGLARHAEHHSHPSIPYQSLRYPHDSPQLPFGYFGMTFLVRLDNAGFQRMALQELERKKTTPDGIAGMVAK